MRHLLFIIVLCVLVSACHNSSPHDKAILKRADKLMESRPDSALRLLKTLHSPKTLSSADHALFALLMSQALDKCDQYVESDSLINIAIDYYKHRQDVERAGYAYFYLSRCERNRGNAQGRAEALLQAIPFATTSKTFKLLGFIYSEKATIYKEQNQTDSMLYYHKLALSALQKAGDKRNSVICLLNIGYSNYLLNRFDTALYYLKNAEHMASTLHEPLLFSSIFRTTGSTYFSKKDYPRALYYARLSAVTSDKYDYDKWTNLAQVFIKTGDPDSAHYYLRKCLLSGNKPPICYQLFQEIAEKRGMLAEALDYSKLADKAKDSVNKQTLETSFAGMDKKYNYERVSTENKTLIISNQRNNILVLLLLLGISAIVVAVLLWRFRNKQLQLKQHQILVEKEMENNQLLRQQLTMQQALLKNMEHHKKLTLARLMPANSATQPAQKTELDKKDDTAALYDELILSVDGLYNGISQRLILRYPQLTATDILICCLLRAGFDSGMIASLIDTQTDSFNVRRFRLRKKLEISREESIPGFLAKF